MPSDSLPAYRKFSKLHKSLFRVAELWAAPDHLLLVTSAWAFEKYRRFYFKDIEALIIRPTESRRTWIIMSLLFLLLFLAIAGLFEWFSGRVKPSDKEVMEVFAIISCVAAGLFFFVLLWQLVLGPTCVVYLQMRTGLEKLKFFDRLRPALKMRDRLAQAMAEQPTAP